MWSAEAVLVCALSLLPRTAASPPIQLVDAPPAGVSSNAEAFVIAGEARIYLVTSTEMFRRARQANDRCGDLEAHRWIAAVIVHEAWHVLHGADEAGAYTAQLMALTQLGAGPDHMAYAAVRRSMRSVVDER
jgi:hypothetical protein